MGGHYRNAEHEIGASLRLIGERANLDSVSIINIYYGFHWQQFEFMLNVENALNGQQFSPNLGEFNARPLPSIPASRIKIGVNYQF
jgi:hypothetical protein